MAVETVDLLLPVLLRGSRESEQSLNRALMVAQRRLVGAAFRRAPMFVLVRRQGSSLSSTNSQTPRCRSVGSGLVGRADEV
jgi:hypothetical protein